MKDESQAIGGYIARVPEARRERAFALHGLILGLFPQAEVSMALRRPTYRLGRNTLAWANARGTLVIYTQSGERIAGFRARHPEVKGALGSLRFGDGQRLPLADLAQVVRNALAPSRPLLARELARGRR